MRLRLLPFVLVSCCFLFIEKTIGIVAETIPAGMAFWITESNAQTPADTKPAEGASSPTDTSQTGETKKDSAPAAEGEKKDGGASGNTPSKPEDAPKEEKKAGDGAPDGKKKEGENTPSETEGTTDNTGKNATPAMQPPEKAAPHFTPEEVEILQRLSERRQQLDKREQDLLMKENVLNATEMKINKKLGELAALKSQVDELLKNYEEKENTKISKLVKIYINMKPKEAALIFERTELPVLLEVLSQMPEKKAAPILAKMDPQYAKDVTTALALRKRLPE